MDKNDAQDDIITFTTSDIYFSSYICALDIPLKRTESEGEKKKLFVFEISKSKLNELKTSFFGGSGVVKVNKFVQALRNLKSACYT